MVVLRCLKAINDVFAHIATRWDDKDGDDDNAHVEWRRQLALWRDSVASWQIEWRGWLSAVQEGNADGLPLVDNGIV
jgi:hypothetical protein